MLNLNLYSSIGEISSKKYEKWEKNAVNIVSKKR
jgi:hypothetical protein